MKTSLDGHIFVLDEADVEAISQQMLLMSEVIWEIFLRRKIGIKHPIDKQPTKGTSVKKRPRPKLPIGDYF